MLHDLAAPRELVDWVRQMPHESAAQTAWTDATRAEWMPFLAKLRGVTDDASCARPARARSNLRLALARTERRASSGLSERPASVDRRSDARRPTSGSQRASSLGTAHAADHAARLADRAEIVFELAARRSADARGIAS